MCNHGYLAKKTVSFAVVHFAVAFTVGYLLTGDYLTASLIALIEPMANTVAFYFHEMGWERFRKKSTVLPTNKVALD